MNDERIEKQVTDRIDDIKWFVGIFSGSVAILVTGLSIVVGLNLSSEKASLKEFKDQTLTSIDKRLGDISAPAKIILLNINGGKLHGSNIEIKFDTDEAGKKWIHIPYRINNIGGSWSGAMFAKIYANNPVCFSDIAALNPDYETETFIDYTKFNPSQIPPGVSIKYHINVTSLCDLPVDVPIKINYVLTYGNGDTADATFNVIRRN